MPYGKEFLQRAYDDPPGDVREFASRIVDYMTDTAMLMAVDAFLNDASVDILPTFWQIFDATLHHTLEGLDKRNPRGAAEFRRGIMLGRHAM